jgi:hypothetical protein
MPNLPDPPEADKYRRCAKNGFLGISTICLRFNFPRALISTKFDDFWMDTIEWIGIEPHRCRQDKWR